MPLRRKGSLSALNPFGRIERGMEDERMADAVAVVETLRPDLATLRPAWFGGGLDGDTRARYVAVGYTAAPDSGLEEGRGYVVDVRSGHVIWQAPLERRADLPRSLGEMIPRA